MKIGVLTRLPGYTVRRIQEEAETKGHEVHVIRYPECYVNVEEDKPEILYRGESLKAFDAIIPRILDGPNILPGMVDYGVAIIRQFEMMGTYTTTKSIALTRARNKLRSLQLFSKSGVGIPKTIFSRETDQVDDLIGHFELPIIIKLISSSQGKGVVLAETKKAAKSVIQALYVSGTGLLIQEYISEAKGSDIRAFVVGGKVVASMKRQSLDDDFRSNIHQGGNGSKIKLTDAERKLAIRAAKAMGLYVCGVDMIQSNRGPLVMEVNPAPGLEGIEKVTGRNVAQRIINYVEISAKAKRQKRDRVGA